MVEEEKKNGARGREFYGTEGSPSLLLFLSFQQGRRSVEERALMSRLGRSISFPPRA